MKRWWKIIAIVIFECLTISAVFWLMPFEYASYRERGGLTVTGGEITRGKPFSYCPEYDLKNAEKIHIVLGTFDRINTSTYNFDLYEPLAEGPNIMTRETFRADSTTNNGFRMFRVSPGLSGIPLCFSLSSPDAESGNAITVWMNEERRPLVKIVSRGVLAEALDRITAGNMFRMGNILPILIFFVYVAGAGLLALYLLFFVRNDAPEVSQPPHR